jgi:hypothetical protein
MSLSITSPTRGPLVGCSAAALWSSVAFVAGVALLHLIRADLAPRGHVLSEYALGPTGWIMTLAFLALAASFVALLLALKPHLSGWRGRVGMASLAVAAIGATLGGLFTMDPLGTPMDQASTSAKLHNLGFMLGGPGSLLAITFINWALARSPSWAASRAVLVATAAFAWAAMVAFFIAVSILMGNPEGGDRFIGVWNRLLVVSWVVWVVALALHSRRA